MKSTTTEAFWERFNKLPRTIQEQANEAYSRFRIDPYHPSLHFKCVNSKESIYSARVGSRYRVLGVKEGDTICWFWIGSHEDYNKII